MTAQGTEHLAQVELDDDLGCDHPLTRLCLLLEIAEQPEWLRDLVPQAAARRTA
ncbi:MULTISPECIES: hypothetical protein [Streptomyces]|uniref:Uncharacterized protein n=1 Tax=Streptomyces cacaoi TaxID=1898 RepID=A0A4Y3QRS7_STRCI|nr:MULTISPECIES: hypothetical protein [Streptomyces]NNG85221.1 hypothetical protein [Streptomyces cacaoi]GEB47639.1 hypothetical protein SCA03_01900 [Streptomyces cacaoi]